MTSASASTIRATDNERAAAKARLCHIADLGITGQAGKGGVRVDGQLNLPVVIRMMNSAAAVQNALTPSVPTEVADAARTYVDNVFDLTVAANNEKIGVDDLNKQNDATNSAIDTLQKVCGLPR